MVTASDEWLLERGVGYWAGLRSLPLWLPRADAAFAQRGTGALNASLAVLGMGLSPLVVTMERTLADELARGLDRARRSGLTRQEELELVAGLG